MKIYVNYTKQWIFALIKIYHKIICLAIASGLTHFSVIADESEYSVSAMGNTSSGDFAPYYIGSLNNGRISQKTSALTDVSIIKELDYESPFSVGYGAEVIAGTSSANVYDRWDAELNEFTPNNQHQARAWIQQLYLEAKYRSIFISAGCKEHTPALLNPELSSGDFVESGNARPIPEVRAGFHDFVDIPLTQGWVQINGQVGYGKMTDDKWLENHFNYYNYHITTGSLYTYKYCFLRSNPECRLIVTAGMQMASLFGGKAEYYNKGNLTRTEEFSSDLNACFKMFLPVLSHEEDFVQGSSIGSWDFYSQYLLDSGSEIAAYFQWPFEDGSGIARRNKLDGIWGFEFRNSEPGLVSEIVLEYIDFRDQSGPIHYAPDDWNGTSVTTGVSGKDNYYNNNYYNSYANYGLSIGTPFLIAPLYNLDGYPGFTCNRSNGFHLGLKGQIGESVPYRLLLGHQRGLGTYDTPYYTLRSNTSAMLECKYLFTDNLSLTVQLACDRGTLRGNNFGAMLALRYCGNFNR